MITLNSLSKYYVNSHQVVIGVKNISVTFAIGEFIVVTGASGSGKTTLLNIISGTDNYSDGTMTVGGENTEYFGDHDWERYRKEYIGFVYQDYNLLDSASVYHNVEVAYELNHNTDKKEQRQAVNKILKKTGLLRCAKQKAATLSGGQKQRVAIARALAKDTPIILADEPTGNLDSAASGEIIELLHSIARDKLIIVVTHCAEQFRGKATCEIVLQNGEIISNRRLYNFYEDVKQNENTKPNEVSKSKYYMGRLVKSDIFSDVKNSISFVCVTTLVMLVVLLLGSIFARFSTPYYEGVTNTPVFGTVGRERLILKKEDGTPFTQAELSALRNDLDYTQVVENDILLDLMFECEFKHDYGNIKQQLYASTVESVKISKEALTWGRLPVANDEVILSSDTGEILEEKLRQVVITSVDMSQKTKLIKIVGGIRDNSKYMQTVYFTVAAGKELAEDFTDKYSTLTFTAPSGKFVKDRFTILLSDKVSAGKLYITQNTANLLGISENGAFTIDVVLKNSYYERSADWTSVEIIPPSNELIFNFNMDKNSSTIIVSRSDYARLMSSDSYQVSVYMKNPSLYKDIVEKFEKTGYVAYYPYVINEADNYSEQILTLFWIFCVCLLIGGALVFLSLLLIRKGSKDNVRRIAILQSLGYDRRLVFQAGVIANIIKSAIGVVISVFAVVIVSGFVKTRIDKFNTTFIPYANLPIWFAVFTSIIIAAVYVIYFAFRYRKHGKKVTINQTLKSGGSDL